MSDLDEQSVITIDGNNVNKDILGTIDQYDIIRKLGGGGFGVVYLVRDNISNVLYAIKTFHPLMKESEEEMYNLREKFALVSKLTHSHIVKPLLLHKINKIHYNNDNVRKELHLSAGDLMMVMEYAKGVTLSNWRKQFGNLIKPKVPLDLALDICKQIASALDYAHSEKIIHRDVKPQNIMVETRPNDSTIVRVLDFGLAAEIRSSMSRISTEQGDTSGTRPYMAPEQWQGMKQGPYTDQYALACVLYELVSGEVPFARKFETKDFNIIEFAIEKELPEALKELTARQNKVLLKALSKSPSDRFASCQQFINALQEDADHLKQGDGNLEIEMVKLPDNAQHKGLWIGKFLVTQEQWYSVMGKNPSYFTGNMQLPVESVTWNDCQEFIQKLNIKFQNSSPKFIYRLPTDAEWEYACRADSNENYGLLKNGCVGTIEEMGFYKENSNNRTQPIGQKQPNKWDIYDMHGNVWEWTASEERDFRICRGGSYNDLATTCESSSSFWLKPNSKYSCLGLRLAASIL